MTSSSGLNNLEQRVEDFEQRLGDFEQRMDDAEQRMEEWETSEAWIYPHPNLLPVREKGCWSPLSASRERGRG